MIRSQFSGLYDTRVSAEPAVLESAWRDLATVLRSHVDRTRRLPDVQPIEIDAGRRAALDDSAVRVRIAIERVERETRGSEQWWNRVAELHRIYTATVVTNDRSLVDLLRAALHDHQRARLGHAWLDQQHTNREPPT
jgi:hypothetical protein